MNFTKAVSRFGKSDFNDLVETILNENAFSLPLDEYMDYGGGWMDEDIEFSIDESRTSRGEIIVTGSMCFTESYPTGCSDIRRTEHRRATFKLTIERSSGDGEFIITGQENDEPEF
jgi:hypothetical protein